MRIGPRITAVVLVCCAALTCQVAEAAAEDLFATAAEHYRKHRWQQACDAFAKLLAVNPSNVRAAEARFYSGESLVQLGRWDDARTQFAALLKYNPNSSHARQSRFRVGEAAYMAGDDRAAKEELQAFYERFPNDPLNAYALPYLGSLELQGGNAEVSRKYFAQAVKRFADGPLASEARFGLAQASHLSGQLEAARSQYQVVIDGGGPLAEASLLQLGAAENALGNYQNALVTLDELAAKYPATMLDDKATLARGYALLKLDRPDEAQQALKKIADVPALGPEAPYWLALAQKAQNQWSAAADTLRSIEVDDAHRLAPAIGFHKADALVRDSQLAAARTEFDRVLNQFADSAWADDCQLGKLRVAIAQKDYKQSIKLADELTQRYYDSPLVPPATLAKGQAMAALDKPTEAIAALAPLLKKSASAKIDPQIMSRAQSVLAVSRAKLGQFDEAERILAELKRNKTASDVASDTAYQIAEQALKLNHPELSEKLFAGVDNWGNDGRAQAGLGWTHFQGERWADAAESFAAVLAADPKAARAPEAALLRARSLEHLEQFPAALEMYRTVIEQYPDSPRVPEALSYRARLYEQLNQPADARRDYVRLVEKYPNFSELDSVLHRFAIFERAADPQAAAKLFERLRTEFPASPWTSEAMLQLVEQAVDGQKFDEAEKLLRSLTALQMSEEVRRKVLYQQGRLAVGRGKWFEANLALGELIEKGDDELALSARYLQGEAEFRQGRYERAAQKFAELATKAEGRADPWLATGELRRAQALGQLRRWNESLEVARGISMRFPNLDTQYEADYLIGRAYAAQADFESARQWYAKAIAAPRAAGTETAAMARWMVGESFFHQENFSKALTEYQQIDGKFPRWHAAALMQTGKCAEALDRWPLATESYQSLVKKYPQSEFLAEANRRLDVARHRAFGRSAGGSSPKRK